MTTCDKDGGGVKKSLNSCDIIYGWPLRMNIEMKGEKKIYDKDLYESQNVLIMIRNVLTRRREYGTYLATARRHRRRIKMQKRDE